jgi:hypothetical protein
VSEAGLKRMGLRACGLVMVIAGLALYDTYDVSFTHRVLLPLVMAVGAWALVQNTAAVAMGVTVLAMIHSDLDSTNPIDRIAYPLIAGTGTVTLAVIVWRRFRARIRNTHAARWSSRRTS